MTAVGLNDVKSYEKIIESFTWSGQKTSRPVDLVRAAAQHAQKMGNDIASRFRALLTFSLCLVLRKRKVPIEDIHGIIQVVKPGFRAADCACILSSTSWINLSIVELTRRGWALPRATELFLMSMLSKRPTS